MFAKDYIKWRDDQTMHVAYRGGAVPQSTAELCFVNTRVNFAQGTSLLEMLRGAVSLQCDLCCWSAHHLLYNQTCRDIHKLKHV